MCPAWLWLSRSCRPHTTMPATTPLDRPRLKLSARKFVFTVVLVTHFSCEGCAMIRSTSRQAVRASVSPWHLRRRTAALAGAAGAVLALAALDWGASGQEPVATPPAPQVLTSRPLPKQPVPKALD